MYALAFVAAIAAAPDSLSRVDGTARVDTSAHLAPAAALAPAADSLRPARADSGARTAAGPAARAATRADSTKQPKVPFGFGDFTWMNGQSREHTSPLGLTSFLTASIYLDTYYAYSFTHPRDNTIVGSASVGRHNEVQINLASVGLTFNYQNVIGTLELQTGSQLNIIQDLDGTAAHGRNISTGDLRNIREATAGYHFDKWYGIDVQAGIFASYIGLESYLLAENWDYNRSLVCDFTPFYFQGARVSIYPNDKIKIEPWVMNGFQTYGKWNYATSVGNSFYYRPKEWIGFISNLYYGGDTRGVPQRRRFHNDDSILLRYYNQPASSGISKLALSVNGHYGFEHGGTAADGTPLPGARHAYMSGIAVANRAWFAHDHLAFTVRGETISNPTRYLAPTPTVAGFVDSGSSLWINGVTTTFDVIPNDYFNFRFEFMARKANVPFFAGPGGTTSSDGYVGTTGPFTPDVRRGQSTLTAAINVRL